MFNAGSVLQNPNVGVVAGLAAATTMAIAPAPPGLSDAGWAVAAIGCLMAIWWMTEAVPLPVTALIPIVALPACGVMPIASVTASYAHPLVFLFLGGFFIAKAMERWKLHQRIAVSIMRVAPNSQSGLIAALMAATAFLSMWISNTAAAMVMIPIGQSIMHDIEPWASDQSGSAGNSRLDFRAALILGIAFSATIGGMATLVGTPPNALLAGYLETAQGIKIGFAQWMMLGIPVAIIMLPVTWYLLTRIVSNIGNNELALRAPPVAIELPQRLSAGARLTAAIICIAGLMLIFQPAIAAVSPWMQLSDAGIAMAAAVLLLIVPSGEPENERLLRWEDAATIRWDVLILVGGGLALAGAIETSGLSQAISRSFVSLNFLPLMLTVLLAMALIVYIGELASNTAMAAVFLPVAGAAAVGLGVEPLHLIIPIGLAASLGFMLPVATPPNAIAYGTGDVSSGQMLRAGALLDVAGILATFAITQVLVPLLFAR